MDDNLEKNQKLKQLRERVLAQLREWVLAQERERVLAQERVLALALKLLLMPVDDLLIYLLEWVQKPITNSRDTLFDRLLVSCFPEEIQAEFSVLRQRWYKRKLPEWRIRLQSFLCVLNLFVTQLHCKIQNICLFFDRVKD